MVFELTGTFPLSRLTKVSLNRILRLTLVISHMLPLSLDSLNVSTSSSHRAKGCLLHHLFFTSQPHLTLDVCKKHSLPVLLEEGIE